MHGNILDANSTNKIINQSVKEAVDNKIIESGYVTKDLLDAETTRATEQENNLKTLIGAETSARTNGDEDLSAKIKEEQTRAEGKEKEISDKLAIVDGDSNTEGSFRKAIADVIAAAPEDLDTLKEIADKLADSDDLHTALNQAITEKADASALANEVTRATSAESNLQTAIDTKADATALSNYVLTTALNQQVDTLNDAISAKQDAGNYIECENYENGTFTYHLYQGRKIQFKDLGDDVRKSKIDGNSVYLEKYEYGADYEKETVEYSVNGITSNKYNDCLATSDGTFKPISDFALKTDIPEVDTSDFVSKTSTDPQIINSALGILGGGIEMHNGDITMYLDDDDIVDTNPVYMTLGSYFLEFDGSDRSTIQLNASAVDSNKGSKVIIEAHNENPQIYLRGTDTFQKDLTITNEGISSTDNNANHVFATDGSIADLTQYVTTEALTAVEQKVTANTTALEGKQDAGNYISYKSINGNKYEISKGLIYQFDNDSSISVQIDQNKIELNNNNRNILVTNGFAKFQQGNTEMYINYDTVVGKIAGIDYFQLNKNGVLLKDGDNNHVLTSNASTIDITQYVLKSIYDEKIAALEARIQALETKHTEAAA